MPRISRQQILQRFRKPLNAGLRQSTPSEGSNLIQIKSIRSAGDQKAISCFDPFENSRSQPGEYRFPRRPCRFSFSFRHRKFIHAVENQQQGTSFKMRCDVVPGESTRFRRLQPFFKSCLKLTGGQRSATSLTRFSRRGSRPTSAAVWCSTSRCSTASRRPCVAGRAHPCSSPIDASRCHGAHKTAERS